MLGSSLGHLGHPFYVAFAWLLAAFYSLVPNYAIAIVLLTLLVMVVAFPITLRSTRAMTKMRVLAPELTRLQSRFKLRPDTTAEERRNARTRLNEELSALYKANGVSPTGGFLPLLLQFPIFIILYGTVRGMIHQAISPVTHRLTAAPLYLSHKAAIYQSIHASGGQLRSFGLNLADSMHTSGLSWGTRGPLVGLVVVAIGLQYLQLRQLNDRAPSETVNPQLQQFQRLLPVAYGVAYLFIPAAVSIYVIVSCVFRIVQQSWMYRFDPHIVASMATIKTRMKR